MKQAQTLTDRDLKLVLSRCRTRRNSVRDATLVQFSVYAGLRAKELAHLLISDVYNDAGIPRDQFIIKAAQTKGNSARRVYVSSKLRRVLSDYYPVVQRRPTNTALFQTQLRTQFSPNTMCQLFLDIYHSVGLKDCGSHSGRRTFITRLAEQGVNVRLLAELAGHKHISTTQRYIDINPAQLTNAVELV